MPIEQPRLRFAPSPTGYLHIGSLRTVLFNYLAAKSLAGKLILRIEDTDQKREVAGATKKLIKILDWIGIKFDEGPHIGGKYGPYLQSERLAIYKKYANDLLKKGAAYRCFCTEERLEKMRQDQQAKKEPPHYDKTCKNLREKEIEERIKKGEKFVVRQKMPDQGEIIAPDELRGNIKFKANDLDDHVLLKSNGVPTYQLANVIDDHLMEITHVLRGDEWISSFPKNVLLYKSFGWTPPKYYHLPLILNKDGGKLSKREGDVSVEHYRELGYLPEALINFCALLGWHSKTDNEIFLLKELEKEFNIKNIGIHPAIFDVIKLDYFNGYHIRQKSIDELTALGAPYLEANIKKTKDDKKQTTNFLKKVITLEQERLKKLSEIGELTEYFFSDEIKYEPELLIWKKTPQDQVKNNLQKIYELLERVPENIWTKHSTKDMVMGHIENVQGKTGEYLWPLRVALTGRKGSPGPFEVAEVLDKEESLKRIKNAINKL